MSCRIAIVDDDESMIDALKRALEMASGFSPIDCYRSGAEALAGVAATPADVVIMDVRMPEMSGIECTRRLKAVQPELPIIVLTGVVDPAVLFESLLAGASGYLIKPVKARELVKAITDVLAGEAPLCREASRMLVGSFHQVTIREKRDGQLSPREKEIMARLFQGHQDKEIARGLGIGLGTVHSHMHRMFEKLGARSRSEAILKYLSPG